jgi:hypothetical protein
MVIDKMVYRFDRRAVWRAGYLLDGRYDICLCRKDDRVMTVFMLATLASLPFWGLMIWGLETYVWDEASKHD